MNTIYDYFFNAQLSLAAYTDFNGNYDSTNVITQLMAEKGIVGFRSPDFTTTSAQNFVNQFTVLDQYTDSSSGFSATMLQDKQSSKIYLAIRGTELTGLGDISADASLVTGHLARGQLISLVNYVLRLQAGAA